jgi:hypothetical protein
MEQQSGSAETREQQSEGSGPGCARAVNDLDALLACVENKLEDSAGQWQH